MLRAPIGDSALTEIVRRQLHRNGVSRHNTDEMFPHSACDVGYDFMAVLEFDTKLDPWKRLYNSSSQFDDFFIYRHKYNKSKLYSAYHLM